MLFSVKLQNTETQVYVQNVPGKMPAAVYNKIIVPSQPGYFSDLLPWIYNLSKELL